MKKENPNAKKAVTAAKIVASLTASVAIGMQAAACGDQDKNSRKDLSKLSGFEAVFDPHHNEIPTVYGPPSDIDPSDNENQRVYGPPPDFDPSDNNNTEVYGPPEDFDPSDNENPDVYGPPEDFDTDDVEF